MTDRPDSTCKRSTHALRRALAAAALVITACVRTDVAAQPQRGDDNSAERFADPVALDPAIPSPESIVGHAAGERAVRYPALVRYLEALAVASPAVTHTP